MATPLATPKSVSTPKRSIILHLKCAHLALKGCRKDFAFIACEKAAPFLSHLHLMGPEVMAWANIQLHKTLAVIARAEKDVDYGTGWGDYTLMEKPPWL